MENKAIRKIMERETALKTINEIKNNICDVDLDDICGEEVNVSAAENKTIFNKTIQAVMCGLVYWDNEKKCMVQKLIHPIKSGEISADALYYSHKLTLSDAKSFDAKNQSDLMIKSLATVCARPPQLIEKIQGQDLNIAMGCISFFDR